MRRAIRLQDMADWTGVASAIVLRHQLVDRSDHLLRLDRLQAFVRNMGVRTVVDTLAAAPQHGARRIRTVTLRPRRTKKGHYGHSQRSRQVHGTGVSSDE